VDYTQVGKGRWQLPGNPTAVLISVQYYIEKKTLVRRPFF